MSAPSIIAPPVAGGGGGVGGSGTINTIPLWLTPTTLTNSALSQSGTTVTGSGQIRATGTSISSPAFARHDAATTGMYFPGANEIGFTTGSGAAMYIGAASATPPRPVSVGQASGMAAQFGVYRTTTGVVQRYQNGATSGFADCLVVFNAANTATTTQDAYIDLITNNGVATEFMLGSSAAVPVSFRAGGTERMRMSQTGAASASQVAIGTTSFTAGRALTTVADLDVYGVRVGRGAGDDANSVAVGPSALDVQVSGLRYNTAIGASALAANTTGQQNTAVGRMALAANTTANNSTAVGHGALTSNTGAQNTAVGSGASFNQTAGTNNTSVGHQAGWSVTTNGNNVSVGQNSALYQTGGSNTALGAQALQGTLGASAAFSNVAVGVQAGWSITTGGNNVFIGNEAGKAETTGAQNVYIGTQAGLAQVGTTANTYVGFNTGVATTGAENTAIGRAAFAGAGAATQCVAVGSSAGRYISGNGNTSVGYFALAGAGAGAIGGANTAVGLNALSATTTGANNSALGYQSGVALTSGASNVFVGWGAGNTVTTGSQNICIGVGATTAAAGNSNQLVIGSSGNYVATQVSGTGYFTTATAVSTGTLPATCGFIRVLLNGTYVKIPVYAD